MELHLDRSLVEKRLYPAIHVHAIGDAARGVALSSRGMGAGAGFAQNDGGASADRGDGEVDRESGSNEDERGIVAERAAVIATDFATRGVASQTEIVRPRRDRHGSRQSALYFEKLCLLQLSFGGKDYLIDTLAGIDLAPFSAALAGKEIVLQGADFDLRLMRRTFGFIRGACFRHGDCGATSRESASSASLRWCSVSSESNCRKVRRKRTGRSVRFLRAWRSTRRTIRITSCRWRKNWKPS